MEEMKKERRIKNTSADKARFHISLAVPPTSVEILETRMGHILMPVGLGVPEIRLSTGRRILCRLASRPDRPTKHLRYTIEAKLPHRRPRWRSHRPGAVEARKCPAAAEPAEHPPASGSS